MSFDLIPELPLRLASPGAAESSYPFPALDREARLVLEPGEAIQLHTAGALRIQGEEVSSQTPLLITDRRIAWIEHNWTKAAGLAGAARFAGVLAVGMAAYAIDDATQRARARREAGQTAGTFAVGHARYEWLERIALRKEKALLGPTDSYLDLIPHRGARLSIHFGAFAAKAALAEQTADLVAEAATGWVERIEQMAPPESSGNPMLAFSKGAEIDSTKHGGRTWRLRSAPPPLTADALSRAHAAWRLITE